MGSLVKCFSRITKDPVGLMNGARGQQLKYLLRVMIKCVARVRIIKDAVISAKITNYENI